jgi:L-ascorbate metabolism protein UlaG (beta-lactamase superfamily)
MLPPCRFMKSPSNPPPRNLGWVLFWLGPIVWLGAQPAPEFTGIQRLTNREILLQLSAPAGRYYRIDTSTNTVDWHGLLTLSSTNLNQHADSAAPSLAARFYRALELTGSDLVTGDHLLTTNGDVIIHPINHATLVMKWNNQMIYVDPVGGATPFQGLPRADLILVTHSHSDHFSTATLDAVRGASAVILAPQIVYNAMTTTLRSLTTVLTNGASTDVLGLKVDAVPAYNLIASQHPRGVGNGYVLTIAGQRVYISGDTDNTPEIRGLRGIDLAFVSMNVPFTMSLDQAVSAVRAFQPKVVYPYHYRNQDGTYTDLNSFKRQVGTDLGIEVRLRAWY